MKLLFHKLYWNLRDEGFRALVSKLFRSLWEELRHGSEILYFLDLSGVSPERPEPPPGLSIHVFRKKEEIPAHFLESMKSFVRKEHMAEEFVAHYTEIILRLFRDGATMHVAASDGRAAAYVWTVTHEGNFSAHFTFFPLVPGDALVFSGMTLPSFRGRGIVPLMIRHVSNHLKAEGRRRLFASCKEWNTSSSRCILKGGLKPIGSARRLRFPGKDVILWRRRKGN